MDDQKWKVRDVASKIIDVLLEQELSSTELAAVLGILNARLYKVMNDVVSNTSKFEEVSSGSVQMAVPKKQGIKYGGPYDPQPPMNPEPVPARVESGRTIAHANDACLCNICNKVVYVVNKDIHDNCKVADFIESFTPMPGFTKLPRTSEIQNIDGTICTDCPSCNGSKTLYLTGKPSADTFSV